MGNEFRESLKRVRPILMREPLAETLGVLIEAGASVEYTFIDVVKMAGHACPTVAGAYVCCQIALEKLYPDTTPVRGEIAVTVYGDPEEGVYGVMAQVFSYITGAAPATGFKGLGPRFKRRDLLRFQPDTVRRGAMLFQFRRTDSGRSVTVGFRPDRIPFPDEKAAEMGRLMVPVVWEAANLSEQERFHDLWMEKVERMLLDRDGIDDWIVVEESAKDGGASHSQLVAEGGQAR